MNKNSADILKSFSKVKKAPPLSYTGYKIYVHVRKILNVVTSLKRKTKLVHVYIKLVLV